jgi:hypothetical protein
VAPAVRVVVEALRDYLAKRVGASVPRARVADRDAVHLGVVDLDHAQRLLQEGVKLVEPQPLVPAGATSCRAQVLTDLGPRQVGDLHAADGSRQLKPGPLLRATRKCQQVGDRQPVQARGVGGELLKSRQLPAAFRFDDDAVVGALQFEVGSAGTVGKPRGRS